jgi:hypothetical protein
MKDDQDNDTGMDGRGSTHDIATLAIHHPIVI